MAPTHRRGKIREYITLSKVAPYLLTSEGAVLAAAAAGHVTITRVAENDFKCPIQR